MVDKSLFKLVRADDPDVEDDMYEFIPNEDIHIQVSIYENKFIVWVDNKDESFSNKGGFTVLDEAMATAIDLNDQLQSPSPR